MASVPIIISKGDVAFVFSVADEVALVLCLSVLVKEAWLLFWFCSGFSEGGTA